MKSRAETTRIIEAQLVEVLPPLSKARYKTIDEFVEKDRENVRKLAAMFCTVQEIAAFIGCHIDTIYENFSEALRDGKEKGKCSIKHAMFQKAVYEKDTKMLIWLSKQHLGMKEPRAVDDEQKDPVFYLTVNELPA